MAKNAMSYKKSTTTTLEAAGLLDAEGRVLDTDGESINIDDLLNEFADEFVELQLKLKDDEELVLEQELG